MSTMRVVTVICVAAVFVSCPLPAAARQAAVALSSEPEAPSVAPDDDAPLELADLLGASRLKDAALEAEQQ
jgi:hypothetical protein